MSGLARRKPRPSTVPNRGRPSVGTVRVEPRSERLLRTGSLNSAVASLVGVALFLFGGTWDISWHIVAGRESFWSPPHFALYLGIVIIFGAGVHGLAKAWRRRVAPTPGAFISATGAGVSLVSAPLDELWHRVYGLDVTVWSAPHLLLIGGVVLASFGAVVTGAHAHRHRSLPAPWLAFDAPWNGATAILIIGGGLMMGAAGATLAEFDFDVARFAVAWHPPILAGIASFGIALVGRASRRSGGAILAAAAYTLVRIAIDWVQRGLSMPRPDIPLVVVAALAFEAVIAIARARWPGRTPGAMVAAGAGGATAVFLGAVQWPYTTALAGAVWSGSVLAQAAAPSILVAAVAAWSGWAIGRQIGDLAATGIPNEGASFGRSRVSELLLAASAIGLATSAIAPAVAQAGAPRERWDPPPFGGPPIVGQFEITPAVPVVGSSLTVRLLLTDATLLQTVGRAAAVPFESPRAGDVVEGAMRSLGTPGAYEATFVPREAGRRWLDVFLPGEYGRVAVSTGFTTYLPDQAGRAAQSSTHHAVLRPEPGPDESRPDWLEPVAVGGIATVLAGASLLTGWSVRRAS